MIFSAWKKFQSNLWLNVHANLLKYQFRNSYAKAFQFRNCWKHQKFNLITAKFFIEIEFYFNIIWCLLSTVDHPPSSNYRAFSFARPLAPRGGKGSVCFRWWAQRIDDNRFRNNQKVSSRSSILARTYLELAPKCFPPLVRILKPRRKLSQSSTPFRHPSHAKAAR